MMKMSSQARRKPAGSFLQLYMASIYMAFYLNFAVAVLTQIWIPTIHIIYTDICKKLYHIDYIADQSRRPLKDV